MPVGERRNPMFLPEYAGEGNENYDDGDFWKGKGKSGTNFFD